MYTYPINVQLTAITVTTAGITIIMSVTYNYITTETRSHAVSSPCTDINLLPMGLEP